MLPGMDKVMQVDYVMGLTCIHVPAAFWTTQFLMLALHQIFLQAEKSMHYSTSSNTQTHTKYHIYMGNKTEGEPWWYIYLCISEGMKIEKFCTSPMYCQISFTHSHTACFMGWENKINSKTSKTTVI